MRKMFSQNLVSGRELFSSNPCRDFWDSQQFSQAASGSQSSQQSSVELFSQSTRCSQSQQQRISTSCDWWSNTGNSQQTNEDEPVKYYMKYLSKPPIFSEQSRKDQEKTKAESFKDFIETQKTKTLERDQRDLLDTFIGLLKDYTKEIQTAMKTFEESLDNSLSTTNTNFEKMSSVAEKSFSAVDELKEDFDNRFHKLKEELKESEELRCIILKNEQNMTKMNMEIQLQLKQIEDFKRREDEALRREEKYKQREDQLLERIKETERPFGFRDTPPLSQPQDLPVLQRNQRHLLETEMQTSNPSISRKDMVPSHQHTCSSSCLAPSDSERLGHYCTRNTNTSIQSIAATSFPSSQRVLQKCYHGEPLAKDAGSACSCFPSLANAAPVTQMANKAQGFCETNARISPLQTIKPVSFSPDQRPGSSTQCLPLNKRQKTSTSFPITVVSPTIRPSVQQEKQHEQPIKTAPSPANRLSLLNKDKWPKQSPVATVLPQVQVRQETPSHDQRLSQDKKQEEDPLGIFTFDLTTSPVLENCETTFNPNKDYVVKKEMADKVPIKTKSVATKKRQKNVPAKPVHKYGTRFRGKIEESENTSTEKGVPKKSSKNSIQSDNTSSTRTITGLKRKIYNTVVANNKTKCYIGITSSTKSDAKELDFKMLEENSMETQVPKETSRPSFKRSSEKRVLNLGGSSLFGSVDEDFSLKQIKESIRKHVLKRQLKQKSFAAERTCYE